MFKKQQTKPFTKLFLISLLLLAFPLVACGALSDTAAAAPTEEQQDTIPVASSRDTAVATTPVIVEKVTVQDAEVPTVVDDAAAPAPADLTVDEIADILFMREEEKMARDVYLALYDLWAIPAFQNIAASEQAHMDVMLGLINTYGLTDPVGSNEAGIFTDPTLQALYAELIEDGRQSAADALLVGAVVEEIDILDLQGSLAQTHREDIVAVYHNLLAGSENHLRAFVSSWERQTGEVYQPQHLHENDYADIMGGDQGGNGQGYGANGGQGQGQGGQGQGQGQGGQGNGNRGQGKGRGGNGGTIDNGLGNTGGRGQR